MKIWQKPAFFYGVLGAALVGALVVVFLKLLPAAAATEKARIDAAAAVVEAAHAAPGAAGVNYRLGVERFAAERKARTEEFEAARVRAAAKLSAWFPDVVPEGARLPARDAFQRAYAFHRDRLDNAVRDLLRKSGGPEIGETPVMKPAFLGGQPPKDEEMARWQRLANVERLFLEAAAKQGAFPIRAIEVEPESRAIGDADVSVARYRVRGVFAAPTRRIAALLEALVRAGDDAGGLARLDGFAVEPGAPELPVAPDEDPPLLVSASLGFSFPLPAGEGAAK